MGCCYRLKREAQIDGGLPVDDEDGEGGSAPSSSSSSDPEGTDASAGMPPAGEDDTGFFDELDEEDDGWVEEEYGAWARRKGPFDDLFRGSAAGPLLQQKRYKPPKQKPQSKGNPQRQPSQ